MAATSLQPLPLLFLATAFSVPILLRHQPRAWRADLARTTGLRSSSSRCRARSSARACWSIRSAPCRRWSSALRSSLSRRSRRCDRLARLWRNAVGRRLARRAAIAAALVLVRLPERGLRNRLPSSPVERDGVSRARSRQLRRELALAVGENAVFDGWTHGGGRQRGRSSSASIRSRRASPCPKTPGRDDRRLHPGGRPGAGSLFHAQSGSRA